MTPIHPTTGAPTPTPTPLEACPFGCGGAVRAFRLNPEIALESVYHEGDGCPAQGWSNLVKWNTRAPRPLYASPQRTGGEVVAWMEPMSKSVIPAAARTKEDSAAWNAYTIPLVRGDASPAPVAWRDMEAKDEAR